MKKPYKYIYSRLEKLHKNEYFITKKPHEYEYPTNLAMKVVYQDEHNF